VLLKPLPPEVVPTVLAHVLVALNCLIAEILAQMFVTKHLVA